ncbi:MAG: hypothetical protein M1816_000280 [Peltula sp. TS41687]|nr:MAG: hypothetical protein M1816_000280 [Peltula sp. TS41687]
MRAGRANSSGRRSVSYSAFPPVTPPNNPPKNLPSNAPYPLRPTGSKSVRTPSGPKAYSRPATARQIESRSTTDSSAILQYPVINPPSTQGSWATSSGETLERNRMIEGRLPHRWNTGSSSGGYSVGRIDEGNGDEVPRTLAQTPRALPQGLVGVALTSHGQQAWPQNIGGTQVDNIPSTIRLVGGPQIQNNRPRGPRRRSVNNRESYPSDRARDARRKRDENRLVEPGARDSIVSTGFPAWAKVYYSRGAGESAFDALEAARRAQTPKKRVTLDKNLPPSPIRPPPPGKRYYRRSSPAFPSPRTYVGDLSTERSTLRKPVEVVWSPHLYHDRSSKRLSVWQAPQVEEKTADGLFSRRRIQIIFFCVGFIFPFAWMIAAFLPLPFNPRQGGGDDRRSSRIISSSRIEDMFEKKLNPIDQARYDSARWWRNLNRILSLLGLLILGAIIALVVIAVRTRSS